MLSNSARLLSSRQCGAVLKGAHQNPKWRDQRFIFFMPIENDASGKRIEDPVFEFKVQDQSSVERDPIIGVLRVKWSELAAEAGKPQKWFHLKRKSTRLRVLVKCH